MSESIRTFQFIPLSPIHIGSGETISPEDYVVAGNQLIRFDPHAIVRSLNQAGREKYEGLLDRNLGEALQFLRGFFMSNLQRNRGSSPLEMYRMEMGFTSSRGMNELVENPRRKGEVHALIRNPYTGDAVIPGSAIKGAIRTALVSTYANPGGKPDKDIERRLANTPERQKSQVLQEAAFDYRWNKTESDPMRLVEVTDASWPAAAVRVDHAQLVKLGRDPGTTANMQMHWERLVSQADNVSAPDCRIRIKINLEHMAHRCVRELVQRRFDWNFVTQACNYFFWNRLEKERSHFEEVFPDASRWLPDVTELQGKSILLRVGRHCHFDSMSADHFRQGWNAARREPIHEIGATRTLCELAGRGWAPFGWVLLRPTV